VLVLGKEAFEYYDDVNNKWVMDGGSYEILVGASSRDIKLTGMQL